MRLEKPDLWVIDPLVTATPELWRGLVAAVIANEGAGPLRDIVSGRTGTGGTWDTQWGRGVDFTNAQNADVLTWPADLSGGYTLLWAGIADANTNWDAWGALISVPRTAGADVVTAIQRNASTTTLNVYHDSVAVAATLTTTIAGLAGAYHELALVFEGTSLKEYLDGVLVTDHTISRTPAAGSDSQININRARDAPQAAQFFSHCYLWDRPLTAGEVVQTHVDPFALARLTDDLFNPALWITSTGGNLLDMEASYYGNGGFGP